jgi:hypothetical protein
VPPATKPLGCIGFVVQILLNMACDGWLRRATCLYKVIVSFDMACDGWPRMTIAGWSAPGAANSLFAFLIPKEARLPRFG